MKIVRITLNGHGCEIARGIISKKDYVKVSKSHNLDEVWLDNLYNEKVKKEFQNIEEQINEIGLISGDITIEVDNEIVLDTPINILEVNGMCRYRKINYPETENIVLTSIQNVEGVVCDTIFVTAEDFDIKKLTVIKKEVETKVDFPQIPSLFCQIRYDNEIIPITGKITDLRMSRLYYDTHEQKNTNRRF